MKLFFLNIILQIILFCSVAHSQSNDRINILKQYCIELNGIKYISLSKLEVIFLKNEFTLNQNEIRINSSILRVAPGSFFIFYEDSKVIKIAQMTSPAIRHNGNTYLPFETFFEALIRENIFFKKDKNLIVEDSIDDSKLEIFKYRNSYSEPIIEKVQLDSLKIDNDFNSKKAIKILKEDRPPDYYYLPDNLIREELNETKSFKTK